MKLILLLFVLIPGSTPPVSSYSLTGTITDKNTGDPIPFAYVYLEEIHRSAVADVNGKFFLNNVPRGEYTLIVHHIGYKTQHIPIQIGLDASKDEQKLTIELSPTTLSSQVIEVTGEHTDALGANLEHASRKFFGADLRRDLGATLAQTLTNTPGFDQRTMGSAPGRPVIRGLGDERVVILQDGMASGDISAQSADHAVTIDPVAAQEIEIARGPAALAYGANAVGGVINVVQNQIASSLPASVTGSATLTGTTVNSGLTGALNLRFPHKNLAVTLNLNGRFADDTNTPIGVLENSYFKTTNDAIGISWIQDWGYIGSSFGTYLSRYGIPPDPNGHPNGVDIEMSKFQYVLKSEWVFNKRLFQTLEADFSINNYQHKEFETSEIIGTEFGLVSTSFDVRAKHRGIGLLDGGSVGIVFETEDYAVSGAGTPASNSYKTGAYIIEEADFNRLHLEGGLRLDWVLNTTNERDLFYPTGAASGSIDSTYYKNRNFLALSSSASAIYNLGAGVSIGATVLHSFRAPSLEELYSEGPHLASYSFEIGNPDLDPERGLAKEIFTRYKGRNTVLEVALFHNGFDNYLYAQNTGEANRRHPTLNDYQFVGTNARFYGFDVSAEKELFSRLMFQASASYTFASQDSTAQNGETVQHPLPQIPPLKINLGVNYTVNQLEMGMRMRIADKQTRTGEFETPTDGYTLLDAFAQYRISKNKLLHTFSLNITNLLDDEYYNHLSRIKDFQPEPGRNISILYRLYF